MMYPTGYAHRRFRRHGDPLARVTPPSPPCPVVYDFGKCDVCLAAGRRDHWTHLREIAIGEKKIKICQIHFDEEMERRAVQGQLTYKWGELEPAIIATEEE